MLMILPSLEIGVGLVDCTEHSEIDVFEKLDTLTAAILTTV